MAPNNPPVFIGGGNRIPRGYLSYGVTPTGTGFPFVEGGVFADSNLGIDYRARESGVYMLKPGWNTLAGPFSANRIYWFSPNCDYALGYADGTAYDPATVQTVAPYIWQATPETSIVNVRLENVPPFAGVSFKFEVECVVDAQFLPPKQHPLAAMTQAAHAFPTPYGVQPGGMAYDIADINPANVGVASLDTSVTTGGLTEMPDWESLYCEVTVTDVYLAIGSKEGADVRTNQSVYTASFNPDASRDFLPCAQRNTSGTADVPVNVIETPPASAKLVVAQDGWIQSVDGKYWYGAGKVALHDHRAVAPAGYRWTGTSFNLNSYKKVFFPTKSLSSNGLGTAGTCANSIGTNPPSGAGDAGDWSDGAGAVSSQPDPTTTGYAIFSIRSRIRKINPIADNLYRAGLVGPSRVVVFNQDVGDTIQATGLIHANVVPTSSQMPFVGLNKLSCLMPNLKDILAQLYNSDNGYFTRITIGSMYDDIIAAMKRVSITADVVMQFVYGNNQPLVNSLMNAGMDYNAPIQTLRPMNVIGVTSSDRSASVGDAASQMVRAEGGNVVGGSGRYGRSAGRGQSGFFDSLLGGIKGVARQAAEFAPMAAQAGAMYAGLPPQLGAMGGQIGGQLLNAVGNSRGYSSQMWGQSSPMWGQGDGQSAPMFSAGINQNRMPF
jgi:hypothetical protein